MAKRAKSSGNKPEDCKQGPRYISNDFHPYLVRRERAFLMIWSRLSGRHRIKFGRIETLVTHNRYERQAGKPERQSVGRGFSRGGIAKLRRAQTLKPGARERVMHDKEF